MKRVPEFLEENKAPPPQGAKDEDQRMGACVHSPGAQPVIWLS